MIRIWRVALGLCDRTVLERVQLIESPTPKVIAHVRPKRPKHRRCGRCGRRAAAEDSGGGRRFWRHLDMGTTQVWLKADAPRVRCVVHGRTVAAVPWARHGARQTMAFEDTVGWLVTRTSKSAVSQLLRVSWRTVGDIVVRVVADIDARVDRLDGLRRIGIDEISYKRGHRYLTVVVDHDTGRLVWAAPGRDIATLERFFDRLGDERAAAITQVSADAADWIANVVGRRCPNAVRCADPFHVVRWATDALDEVRRDAWNTAKGRVRGTGTGQSRRRGRQASGDARALMRARWALWKDPDNLTSHQAAKLDWIAKTHPAVYTAYLLKEGLRYVWKVKGDDGKQALDLWLTHAEDSGLDAFVELAAKIRRHRQSIDAALDHGLSQGRIESVNTKIRLLHRIAFGFKNPDALIALAMLHLGGHQPQLPGR